MSSDPPSDQNKRRKLEPAMFFGACIREADSLWNALHQPMSINDVFVDIGFPLSSQDVETGHVGCCTAQTEPVAGTSQALVPSISSRPTEVTRDIKTEEDSVDSVIICDVVKEEPLIDLETLSPENGDESMDTVLQEPDPDTADEEEPDTVEETNQLVRMKNSIISVLKDFKCVSCNKYVDHTFRLCEEFHFFCSACKPPSCHICSKPIAASKSHNDFTKLLKAIPKICTYAANGCRQFHDDNENCEFRHILCSKCSKNMRVKNIFRHFLLKHGESLGMTKQGKLTIGKLDDKKSARAVYVYNQFFYFTEYFDVKKKKILFTLQVFPIGVPKGEFFLTIKFEKNNENEKEVYEKTVKAINMKGDYQRFLYQGEANQTVVIPFDLVSLFRMGKKEVGFTITITQK